MVVPVLLAILGLLFTGLCRVKCTAFLLHLAWITGYFIVLSSIAFTVFLFFLGVLNQKTCTKLHAMPNSPSVL